MAENGQHDGSLIFDTKIDEKGFRDGLKNLENIAAEKKETKVKANSEVDKSGFEKDKAELEQKAKEGIGKAEAESGVDKSGYEADEAKLKNEVREGLGETEAESGIDTFGFAKDKEILQQQASKGVKDVEVGTAVDASGLKEGIDKLVQIAEESLNRLKEPFDDGKLPIVVDPQVKTSGAIDVMKGVMGSNFLQAGINKIAETAQAGIQLASDLEEVQNVVDVTFGEGKDKIEQFAKTATQSFGLTELQTKQYSSTLGAMMKSMGVSGDAALEMSMDLAGLTGDMASFYNLDHETAFEKIRSGISGETEPLKQLGINMSVANLEAYALTKGLKKAYDQMTEAERVQLRYEYIMQQTADAQGDFVRTQDSYANQVRILQNNLDTMAANIGSMLIPALTSATSWVNSLFAGPEVNETQRAIDEAAASLESLDDRIEAINGDYTSESITARAEYRQAMELGDEYAELLEASDRGYGDRVLRLGMSGDDVEALQHQLIALGYAIDMTKEVGVFGVMTEKALKEYQTDMGLVADGIAGAKTYASLAADDTERLAGVTAEMVAIYPELAEYVGEDGLLTIELGQVRALCAGYRDLKIEKLAAARVEQIGGAYADALLAQEQLKVMREDEQENYDSLVGRQNRMSSALERVDAAAGEAYFSGGQIPVGATVAALKSYEMAGGNMAAAMERAAKENENVYDLFEGGVLRVDLSSAEEIEALSVLLTEVQKQGQEDQIELRSQIDESHARIEQLDTEIAQSGEQVAEAYEQYQAAEEALSRITEGGNRIGADTGKSIASGLSAETEGIVHAVAGIADAAQTEAAQHPITFRTQIRGAGIGKSIADGAHATGLNYVPYDNYLARLHVGEAVLSASEAQTWRNRQQGIDYGALAAAMRASSNSTSDSRPMQIVLDGRVLAEVMAERNRTAINGRSRQIEMGRGK